MSTLVDNLIETSTVPVALWADGRCYKCKPIQYNGMFNLVQRIKDAMKIIKGDAIAVHYKEDEK